MNLGTPIARLLMLLLAGSLVACSAVGIIPFRVTMAFAGPVFVLAILVVALQPPHRHRPSPRTRGRRR